MVKLSRKSPAKKTATKMGRPRTDATFRGFSVRFQTSPDDEFGRLEQACQSLGISKAAFVQKAANDAVNAALKSGRVTMLMR